MSVSSVSVVIGRIKCASESSPIAVFRTYTPGRYNAVFARTVITANRIKEGCADLIGVFHGEEGVSKFVKRY